MDAESGMKTINEDFRQTCRLLFGQEIGELPDFAPYLSETNWPYVLGKSCVSGKEVMLSGPHYPPGAAFAQQEEIASLKFAPLSMNDVKDIDSLFAAASERAVYCGNKVFGKNIGVEGADNVVDGIEVRNSHDIYRSKYVAYCSVGRFSESIYAVNNFQATKNSMRCHVCFINGAQRCFETYLTGGISDSYYTMNCTSCTDLMFCFNLRNRSNCIGNLQLEKGRYAELKNKLVTEMAERLRRDKRLFSMADILGGASGKEERRDSIPPHAEKDLATALRVVLKKEPREPSRLSGWLGKRTVRVSKVNGALKFESPMLAKVAGGRLAPLGEAMAGGQRGIEIGAGEMPSLSEVARRAASAAVITLEMEEGQNQEVRGAPVRYGSSHTTNLWFSLHSKHSGLSSVVTDSEYCFGGYIRILECQFCVNCNNLTKCSGCFECDSCYSCRNCYFCHNCENVEEGILCFNLKGARYAVLNQQVSKEEYARVKGMLLDYLNKELEEKGELTRSIFALSGNGN
jgi:hypothetical protein